MFCLFSIQRLLPGQNTKLEGPNSPQGYEQEGAIAHISFFFSTVIPVAASRTLQDNFNIYRPIAEGIPDHPWGAPITVSTYIPSLQKLVCGYKDGRIITVPALHAAKARLLGEGSVQKGEHLLYFTTRGVGMKVSPSPE